MVSHAVLVTLVILHYASGQVYDKCQPSYITERGTQYQGSAVQASVTDEAGCRTQCDGDPDCLGYDIDTTSATQPCYITTDITITGTTATNINHYIKATACPFTYTSERCFFVYKGQLDITGSFGPLRGINRTLDDCHGTCMDITDCTTSIYTITDRTCKLFIGTSAPDYTTAAVKANDQVYDRGSCNSVPLDAECEERYEKKSGYGVDGGQFVITNNTEESCRMTCSASSECIAYDFNKGQNACFVHTNSRNSPVVKTEVDNYRKIQDCQASQTACSYEAYGAYMPAASYTSTPVDGILSLTECIASCNSDVACTGVVFNIEYNESCVKYTDTTAFTDLQNLQQTTDGRLGYGKTSCGPVTTPTQPPTPGSCTTEYREFVGKKINGAMPNAATTLDSCKAACTSDRTCWAMDYNSADNTCWLFTGYSVMPYTTPIDGLPTETHYEKYLQCGACEYNVYATKKSTLQGTLQSTVSTRDGCLKACSDDSTCQAIDYDATQNKCYLLTAKPSSSQLVDNADFDEYNKVAACTSSTAGCSAAFDFYAGKKIIGGAFSGTTTVTQCEGLCTNDVNCIGYDVNSNSDCYLIKTYGDIVDGVTGENHYHKTYRCDSATYTDCVYFATGLLAPAVAQQLSSTTANTRDDCFNRCTDQNVCSGLSYDRSSKMCVLYKAGTSWSTGDLINTGNTNVEAYRFDDCTSSGSTTVTPSQGVTCTNTWTAFSNTHAQGGIEQPTIATAVACKDACVANPDCVAVDIDDVRVPLCYFHLNLANLDNRSPLDGVTLNILSRCTDTATSTTSTGSATTTTTAGGTCSSGYKEYLGNKIAGGIFVSSVATLDDCKSWCDANAECAGFDFNKNDNTCWWHTKNGPLEVATDGADHYTKNIKCGDCLYEVYLNQKVNLIIGSSSIRQTIDECLNACNQETSCVSVDYKDDKTCWFFSGSYSSGLTADTTTDHYEKYSCQCTPTFLYEKYVNQKVNGGKLDTTATTSTDCMSLCNSQDNCIGFDFNSQNQCWLTDITNTNPMISSGSETVEHYVKYLQCGNCDYTYEGAKSVPQMNGVVQSGINTLSDCVAACTNPTCQTVEFNFETNTCYHYDTAINSGLVDNSKVIHLSQSCVVKCTATYDYDKAEMSKVIGGMLSGSSNTLDLCTQACSSDFTCIGFDFTDTNECWLTGANNRNPIVSSGTEVVSHYTKYAKCGDCRYDIKGASAVDLSNKTVVAGISTWADCVSACTATGTGTTCLSVDFDFVNSQCYKYTAKYETGLKDDANTMHFVQNCNSVSSTDSSTTITITTTSSGSTTSSGATCPPSYISYVNKKVPGLTLVPNMATAIDCQNACTSDSTCVGVDYNTAASPDLACWKQSDITLPIVDQGPGEQVTHYEQKKTCGGCDYKPYTNKAPSSSTVWSASTTEDSCIEACSTISSCQLASFKSNICYHSSSTAKIDETGTKTWEKSGTCGTSTALPPEAMCTDMYLTYANKHVIGGDFIPGVTDSPACRSACDGRPDCVGYDITSDGQCWLIQNFEAQKSDYVSGTGVDHYTKVKSCDGVCYRQIINASFSSSVSYGEQTLDNCLLSCTTQQQNCRDVIYTPSATADKCRFVQSSNPVVISDLIQVIGKVFYSRLSSCQDEAMQVTMATSITTTKAVGVSTTLPAGGSNNVGDDAKVEETTVSTTTT